AVEDTDLSGPGRRPVDPPEEVVVRLLPYRRLEGRDPGPLGVDPLEDVVDGAVLAAGVERLQHHQQRLAVRRPQGFLEGGEPLMETRERGHGLTLIPGGTGGRGRIDAPQLHRLSRPNPP